MIGLPINGSKSETSFVSILTQLNSKISNFLTSSLIYLFFLRLFCFFWWGLKEFKYKKDSVMQVTKGSYKQCNSSHPRFYSNTGKTRFMFDHSVPYYFISGTSGHCEKGQKMIVEVISLDQTTTSSAPPAALAVLLCLFSLSLSFVA